MERDPLEQRPADVSAVSALLEAMCVAGERVIATCSERRGAAEPAALFAEGARALWRVMPALFGPANAQLFGERGARLQALAEALGVEPAEPTSSIEALKVGGYHLRFGASERDHRLQLRQGPRGLEGAVLIDRSIGHQSRRERPDEGRFVLRFEEWVPAVVENTLRFTVALGPAPIHYEFELHWCPGQPDWAGGVDLLGEVRVQGESASVTGVWSPTVPGLEPPWTPLLG